MPEEVNHPDHYGGDTPYEVIKVLRAWDLELAKGFCWGNLIKYTARAGQKGNALKDREKAAWYAAELVSIEAELASRSPKATIAKQRIRILNLVDIVIDWDNRTYDFQHIGEGDPGITGWYEEHGFPPGTTFNAGGADD